MLTLHHLCKQYLIIFPCHLLQFSLDVYINCLSHPPPAPGVKEDEVVGNVELAVIARDHLTQWESLHPFLGLNRAQKKEIARSYPANYGLQKQECLEVWKEVKGDGATYRALISAAEDAKDQELADTIRNMLQK